MPNIPCGCCSRSLACWKRRCRRTYAARVDTGRVATVDVAASGLLWSRTAHPSIVDLAELCLPASRIVGSEGRPVSDMWRAVLERSSLCSPSLSPPAGRTHQMHRLRAAFFPVQRPPSPRVQAANRTRLPGRLSRSEIFGSASIEKAQAGAAAGPGVQLRSVS